MCNVQMMSFLSLDMFVCRQFLKFHFRFLNLFCSCFVISTKYDNVGFLSVYFKLPFLSVFMDYIK